MPDVKGTVANKTYGPKEVGQGILGSKGQGHTPDAQSRKEACKINPERPSGQHKGHYNHDDATHRLANGTTTSSKELSVERTLRLSQAKKRIE